VRTIFVNEKPIFISNLPFQADKGTKIIRFERGKIIFDEVLSILLEKKVSGVCLHYPEEKLLWKEFKNHFKIVRAAGGLVRNNQQQFLFIKRLGCWDLPKGKIEKKENRQQAALREIKEECNLSGLEVIAPLQITYHIYFNEKPVLKVVYWYEMFCKDANQRLIPQVEEGIEAVVWKEVTDIKNILKNTYKNIALLLTNFLSDSQCIQRF